MCHYFSETDILIHLGLSGMNIQAPGLIKLCEVLSCCPRLMAIHLNDNQILNSINGNLLCEILAIFDLGDQDIDQTCWLKKMTEERCDEN